MNAPADVDQTSPLVGEVGAVPGIIRRLDTVVVDPKIFKFVLAEVAIPTPAKVSVGLVSVLFVNVSVVALPTSVSVATGSVRTLDPETAGACRVIEPLVSPAMTTPDIILSPVL